MTQSGRSFISTRHQINPVKARFRIIKWSTLLIAMFVPVTTWYVATGFFQSSRSTGQLLVVAALFISAGVLRLFNNYAADGFARSYANGGTWDYLSARFGVEERPVNIDTSDIISGLSQLDRKEILFSSDVGISEIGVYININELGRILVPWDSVSVLQKHRVSTEDGSQQLASLRLNGPEVSLNIPWPNELDELVPKSVGIS